MDNMYPVSSEHDEKSITQFDINIGYLYLSPLIHMVVSSTSCKNSLFLKV